MTLATVSAANFMAILNISIVNVALPSMETDLRTDLAGLQWVLNAFTICISALTLAGGSLGDRYGRKRFFLIGIGLFVLGSVCCALAPTLGPLIAGRFVQGLAAALLIPGSLSILAQTFTEPAERARKIGIWASLSAVALVLGPVIGGFLIDQYGWASIFWLSVPIGVVAFVMAAVILVESADPQHASLDPIGQLLAVVSLAALSYGLIRLGAAEAGDPLALASLSSGLVLLVVFVIVELRLKRPMLPVRLFADRNFAVMNLASATLGFGPYAMCAFLSLFMQQTQHLSPLQTGLAFLPMSIATAVVAPLSGRWMGRSGPRAPMIVGYGLSGAGILGIVLLHAENPYWISSVVFVLIGLGMGLSMTPTTTAAVTAVPRQRSGIASATINTTRQTGLALGVALLGSIMSSQPDMTTGLHVAAIVAGAASLVAVVLVVLDRAPKLDVPPKAPQPAMQEV
jgi:DHA2 family methylenomycin A resistance protein-like MFS transporter